MVYVDIVFIGRLGNVRRVHLDASVVRAVESMEQTKKPGLGVRPMAACLCRLEARTTLG
jgi:hypothetical protein